MKVCVYGLWHLGVVTAACLSHAGHEVRGLDSNESVVRDLSVGNAPLFEPGLLDLLSEGVRKGVLRFFSDSSKAVEEIDVLWVAFDTPVDENDVADVDFVLNKVKTLLPVLPDNCLVLISSQLPVGSTRSLERAAKEIGRAGSISFGYSPENLRLGKAIDVFQNPDRVVVGLERREDQEKVQKLLAPITDKIIWMSPESAEMMKHALNAFLATSIVFMNEIASICEQVGADAKEVEAGLKSESRIGFKAYLSPGGAFAGGTLARDINFLSAVGAERNVPLSLIPSVKTGNDAHKQWVQRKLKEFLENLDSQKIAVLGLTYKPGTNTLRRSSAIELINGLIRQNVRVNAYDPMVKGLPDDIKNQVNLCDSVDLTIKNVSVVVIMTEWPEFRKISWETLLSDRKRLLVLDANRFLEREISHLTNIQYVTVGKSRPIE